MLEIFKLGWLNQKKQNKKYRFFTWSIFTTTWSILLFFTLQSGGYRMIQNELRRNTRFNDVTVHFTLPIEENHLTRDFKFLDFSNLNELNQTFSLESFVVEYRTKDVEFSLYLGEMALLPPFELRGFNVEHDTFSYTQISYNQQQNPYFNTIIYGQDFSLGNERVAIMDINSARMLGLNHTSEIIGKVITFIIPNNEEIEVQVIGIYAPQLGPVGQLMEDSFFENRFYTTEGLRDIFSDSILVSADVVKWLNRDESLYDSIVLAQLSATNLETALSLYETLDLNFDNHLSSEAEAVTSILRNISIFTFIFGIIGIVLFVLSLLNVCTIAMLNAEKRKKWFSLQVIMGFKSQDIWLAYAVEIVVTMGKGFVMAMVANFLIVLLLNFMSQRMLHGFILDGSLLFESSFIISLLLFSAIFLFVAFIGFIFNLKLKKMDTITILFKS